MAGFTSYLVRKVVIEGMACQLPSRLTSHTLNYNLPYYLAHFTGNPPQGYPDNFRRDIIAESHAGICEQTAEF